MTRLARIVLVSLGMLLAAITPVAGWLRRSSLRQITAKTGYDLNDIKRLCERWKDVKKGFCPKERIVNLCEDLPEVCEGGLYRRCRMPQIPKRSLKDDWKEWEDKLSNEGVSFDLHKNVSVNALSSYGAAQIQLDSCVVCGIYYAARRCVAGKSAAPTPETCSTHAEGCFCAWADGISVAEKDHKILDGHHRWAATRFLMHDTEALAGDRRAEFAAQNSEVASYDATVDRLKRYSKEVESVENTNCGVYARSAAALPSFTSLTSTLVFVLALAWT